MRRHRRVRLLPDRRQAGGARHYGGAGKTANGSGRQWREEEAGRGDNCESGGAHKGRSDRESGGFGQARTCRASRRAAQASMTREAFEADVAEALRHIPRRFKNAMQNIAIVVEDEPSRQLLSDMEIAPPDSLFGL